MSLSIKGRLSEGERRGWGYYVACFSLFYVLVLFVKMLARLAGWQREGRLELQGNAVVLSERLSLLGASLVKRRRVFAREAVAAVSIGSEGEPGVLATGAALLFYGALFGVYKLITGFLVSEPSLIFWGLGLILFGLLLDGLLFAVHWFLQRDMRNACRVTLTGGDQFVIYTTAALDETEIHQELGIL